MFSLRNKKIIFELSSIPSLTWSSASNLEINNFKEIDLGMKHMGGPGTNPFAPFLFKFQS